MTKRKPTAHALAAKAIRLELKKEFKLASLRNIFKVTSE